MYKRFRFGLVLILVMFAWLMAGASTDVGDYATVAHGNRVALETYDLSTDYRGAIANGDFEEDPVGTSKDDISGWDHDIVNDEGNPPTGDDLEIVDDYYFTGTKSVYSYLQTTSVAPWPGDCRASQYLSSETPLSTVAEYVTIWIGGDGYTTSSRYVWRISLVLTDGVETYEEILRCDCWGNNEGCTPNHYDYYDATATGADGNEWKRYTREIPGELDKSNLTVKIRHNQQSWDLTQADSWYRLDNIYFSDADGNPCSPDLAVTSVTPSRTTIAQGNSMTIDITVENQGNCPRTFNMSTVYGRVVANGDFEQNIVETSKDHIADWDHEIINHFGNPPTGDDLEIVDDYYYTGTKSVYSYVQTTSVPPSPGDSYASQYLYTQPPTTTWDDYITLWISGDGYTTSSRYFWRIGLVLTDGVETYQEILRCDCWGNNEGCTPNHYDYYDATATGADGNEWKRYTVEIPGTLDKSNLTVKVRHHQQSWDLTTASSWYRLDNIYFSDADGNPSRLMYGFISPHIITDLAAYSGTMIMASWNTTGAQPGEYTMGAYAFVSAGETDTTDNLYIDDIVEVFVCGDANESGAVDIDDVVYLITYIFAGGPAPHPLESGDADCSGDTDIDDVVYLINYIFAGGFPPCDIDGNGVLDC